jgi:hypothetical protein
MSSVVFSLCRPQLQKCTAELLHYYIEFGGPQQVSLLLKTKQKKGQDKIRRNKARLVYLRQHKTGQDTTRRYTTRRDKIDQTRQDQTRRNDTRQGNATLDYTRLENQGKAREDKTKQN